MIRLYIAESLLPGALLTLGEARTHYVRHVMRLKDGDSIAAFNTDSGEWEATLRMHGKCEVQLSIGKQIAGPRPSPDLWLAFATIKNKSELVVEKATELGVREIHPIVTQHSVVKNINVEKLQAHATLAAEQCERHDVPAIVPHKNLGSFLDVFPKDRILFYGDESGNGKPLLDVLPPPAGGRPGGGQACTGGTNNAPTPTLPLRGRGMCILIGPEGGFSVDEHLMLQSAKFTTGFGMGPRILRADTAAVAALACVQAATGDWSQTPHFKGTA